MCMDKLNWTNIPFLYLGVWYLICTCFISILSFKQENIQIYENKNQNHGKWPYYVRYKLLLKWMRPKDFNPQSLRVIVLHNIMSYSIYKYYA